MAGNFTKLTPEARRVIRLAQDEALRLNHQSIGTEHLLLGLVRESDSVAAALLADAGLDLNRIRSAVEQFIGLGSQAVTGEVGLTPRAQRVMEAAAEEARLLNQQYIGTQHLLLGMLRDGGGVAGGVLLRFGVTLEGLRERARAVVDGQGEGGEQSSTLQSGRLQSSGEAVTQPAPEQQRPEPSGGRLGDGPTFEDLLRVVPVAQSQYCDSVDLTILSVELYADGFLVNARILSGPVVGSPASPQWRFLRPILEAEDERGNLFSSQPYFDSLRAGRKMRYIYSFTPKLDETAQELRLRCTGLRQRLVGRPGEQEIGTQPCTFVIPLHNRPTA